ncbi:1-phosphofructokinase [Butyricicoccus pullicaecorum]|nr:1-phosphofructokinase [Butyricicoccus pullicaecorum]
MIYTVTLNPALDKTVEIPGMALDTVNRITAMRTDPGGKGINVSKVIAKLGGTSVALALLGGGTGRAIADALEEMGLRCELQFVEGETRTNLKVVDPVNHTNTDLNEPGISVTPAVLDGLLDRLIGLLQPGDLVVLSGSLPKGAPGDTYYTWVARCKEAGAKVFLDADGTLLAEGLRAAPDLVKPNQDELSRLVGHPLETVEALAGAAGALLADGVQKVVVSMGGKGALYVTRDTVLYAEGLKVPVGSTVGAGDSVVAALAVAETQGLSLEDTVRLSTATGAANVMCSGSQAAERSVIEELMPQVVFHRLRG